MSEERQLHLLSSYRLATSYPLQQTADEVAAWLNGYAALWHPAALVGAAIPPAASTSYDHDNPRTGFVYAVPEGPHLFQPDNWNDRVIEAKSIVFKATASRAETMERLFTALREAGQSGPLFDAPPDAVRLFAGVGYGYAMLDTLYEAMDHEKLLDAAGFWADVTNAVEALARALDPTSETATQVRTEGSERGDYKEHLKNAAEKLRAGREPVFSGSIHWLDWVHLDPKNLNVPWPASLAAGLPITVLASGETLEQLAEQAPERFAELKAKLPPDMPQAVDLCCGSFRDREDALMSIESQLWNLRVARRTAHKLFGVEPVVYGRKKSAFHPQLPGWLQHMGFKHAVLVSTDGALIPSIRASAVSWPGPDGKSVEAFTREPQPAHDPHTFFNIVYHLHQATSYDSAPTVSLAHKGEPAFATYHDLLALLELAPVFGEWTNLSRYFNGVTSGDYIGVQSADEFFADYLDDRVTNLHRTDPVGGFPRHLRLRRRLDSAYTLAALHRTLTPPTPEDDESLRKLGDVEDAIETHGVNASSPSPLAGEGSERSERVRGETSAHPQSYPSPGGEAPPPSPAGAWGGTPTTSSRGEGKEEDLAPLESHWAKKLADRIQVRSAERQPGLMVFNPCSFTRRVALEVDGFRGAIAIADPVKAAEFAGTTAKLVVEVPAFGFAWVPRSGNAPQPKPRVKLADGATVRNEFIECDVDPTTGGIRSFRDTRTRATRFGQQLVFNPGSKMVARDITVTNNGAALGEIVSTGDIIDERDEVLATFKQRFRAWLGRPVLELRIELDVKHQPTGYPWHAFYGARFGWRDDRGVLFRGVNGANTQTGYTRPVSPDYLEVRLGAERSFLFTGGLPFVQRHGTRMADVILVPEGEQCRTFDLLLATDRDVPMQTALGWVSPSPVVVTEKGPPAVGASSWLAHVDMPSLLVTCLRPCEAAEGATRAVAGTLVETAGFGGAAELRFARDPARAGLVDGTGKPLSPLTMTGDAIQLEYSAGETIRVRAEWI